jgi:mRNA-degrading endonuclease toxin of MazEF toxin-antitoxin module
MKRRRNRLIVQPKKGRSVKKLVGVVPVSGETRTTPFDVNN